MYLNLLNYDDKKLFFALANRLISIDGEISDSEIELLEVFRNEMNLLDIDYLANMELDEIIHSITNDLIVRKIVIFELVSLACIDSECAVEEMEIIHHICEMWDIQKETLNHFKELSQDLLDVSNRISDFILR